jgi:hypothetical protein
MIGVPLGHEDDGPKAEDVKIMRVEQNVIDRLRTIC